MEVYIIRHGQSTNNAIPSDAGTRADREARRDHDPSLTPLGQAQANKHAEWFSGGDVRIPWTDPETGYTRNDAMPDFRFNYVYCSPMYRALQTAAPLAKALNIKPEVWVDIHEHGGIYLEQPDGIIGYPGRNRSEILSEFPDYLLPDGITDVGWWKPEVGHEERGVFYGRAIRVALELRRRAENPDYKNKRLAIITHGTFIDALLKALFNMLPTRSMFFLHYNTALTRLDFNEWGVLVRCINRVDHLPANMIS